MATFPAISPSFELIEQPEFLTNIITYDNKVEQRIAMDTEERLRLILHWKVLSDENKNLIQQFFRARKGRYESFTLNHPRPSQVIGTDILNWTCKLTHIATAATTPVTGGSHTTYWTQTGDRGVTHAVGDRYLYDLLVRFETDSAKFSLFTWLLWNFNSVHMIEVAA